MGFDVDTVRAALNHFNSDVSQVIMELLERGGNIPDDWYHGLTPSNQASASSVHASSSSDTGRSHLILVVVVVVVVVVSYPQSSLNETQPYLASWLDVSVI